MTKSATTNSFFKIFLSYLFFIFLVTILNADANRLNSYLITILSTTIALFYLSTGSNKKFGFNIFWIAIFGFTFKLFIGYIFWQYYIFPDYFTSPRSQFQFNHHEYLLTFNWMQQLAEYRIDNGFLSFPIERLFDKHIFIHYIMSNLYLSGTFNPLDISVQNAYFSILSAYVVLLIGQHFALKKIQLKWILVIAVFQPFSLISSIIWRDVVGQFFIVIGIYLTILATKSNTRNAIIFIILASLSMWLQRFIYLIFPLLAYFFYSLFKRNVKSFALILPVTLLFVLYINSYFLLSEKVTESYGSSISSLNLWLFLPINLMRIFIGPFPWSNWFRFTDETVFLISDYFQAVVNIVLFYYAVKILRKQNFNQFFKDRLNLPLLFFVLFLFTALGTTGIHTSYLSTATIILPLIIAPYEIFKNKVISRFIYVFISFLIFNILLILTGLTGHGILSSFR